MRLVNLPRVWDDVPEWLRRNGWKCANEEVLYAWEDHDGRRYGRWEAYQVQVVRLGMDASTSAVRKGRSAIGPGRQTAPRSA